MRLSLDSQISSEERLEKWLALLREDETSGYITEHVLVQIVRSTPVELRSTAIDKLLPLFPPYEDPAWSEAFGALGGTPPINTEPEDE